MANDDKNGHEKNLRRNPSKEAVEIDDLAKAAAEDLAAVLKRRSQRNRRQRYGRRTFMR